MSSDAMAPSAAPGLMRRWPPATQPQKHVLRAAIVPAGAASQQALAGVYRVKTWRSRVLVPQCEIRLEGIARTIDVAPLGALTRGVQRSPGLPECCPLVRGVGPQH